MKKRAAQLSGTRGGCFKFKYGHNFIPGFINTGIRGFTDNSAHLHITLDTGLQSWALLVFLNFFNNKNDCFACFIKSITYFYTSQSYLKSPLPVKLT